MTAIESKRSADVGCPCGRPFPERVYYVSEEGPPAFVERATFLLTCRCGHTFPLAVEGVGNPALRMRHDKVRP